MLPAGKAVRISPYPPILFVAYFQPHLMHKASRPHPMPQAVAACSRPAPASYPVSHEPLFRPIPLSVIRWHVHLPEAPAHLPAFLQPHPSLPPLPDNDKIRPSLRRLPYPDVPDKPSPQMFRRLKSSIHPLPTVALLPCSARTRPLNGSRYNAPYRPAPVHRKTFSLYLPVARNPPSCKLPALPSK